MAALEMAVWKYVVLIHEGDKTLSSTWYSGCISFHQRMLWKNHEADYRTHSSIDIFDHPNWWIHFSGLSWLNLQLNARSIVDLIRWSDICLHFNTYWIQNTPNLIIRRKRPFLDLSSYPPIRGWVRCQNLLLYMFTIRKLHNGLGVRDLHKLRYR